MLLFHYFNFYAIQFIYVTKYVQLSFVFIFILIKLSLLHISLLYFLYGVIPYGNSVWWTLQELFSYLSDYVNGDNSLIPFNNESRLICETSCEHHVMHCHDGDVSSATLLMAFHIITFTGFALLPHTKVVVATQARRRMIRR